MQSLVRKNYFTIVMLLVGGGFVTILAELIWTGHTKGIQLVAVVASLLGLILAGAGLKANKSVRMSMAILFLLLSITGLFGTFEHFEEGGDSEEHESALLAQPASAAPLLDEGEEGEEYEEGENAPPPFAPLSLAGLSMLGAVALLGHEDN